MKFATIALIATVAAIQTEVEAEAEVDCEADLEENELLETEVEEGTENMESVLADTSAPCISKQDSDDLFNLADTHKRGTLHPRQIYEGVKQMAMTTNNCMKRK